MPVLLLAAVPFALPRCPCAMPHAHGARRKSINTSGPSFGYGFIMAWAFMMAFYTLLCGLVLDSFSVSALQTDPNGERAERGDILNEMKEAISRMCLWGKGSWL